MSQTETQPASGETRDAVGPLLEEPLSLLVESGH